MSRLSYYRVIYKDFADRANKTVRVVARSSAEAVAFFRAEHPKCEVLKCSLDLIWYVGSIFKKY